MIENLDKLRAPFPAHQISYLPKGGVKLAYVGHAALTDRLLDTDATWTWEPLALDERGLPALDEAGGLWIRLTVCGVTRLGYGDAGTKKGGDAMKERIGDALRNAAMRFGAALDLWHKGELHRDEDEPEVKPAKLAKGEDMSPKARSHRITAGVNAGDAAGAAEYLSTLAQAELDSIWNLLAADTQDALTKAWPQAVAA
jgi:hypothetical protein